MASRTSSRRARAALADRLALRSRALRSSPGPWPGPSPHVVAHDGLGVGDEPAGVVGVLRAEQRLEHAAALAAGHVGGHDLAAEALLARDTLRSAALSSLAWRAACSSASCRASWVATSSTSLACTWSFRASSSALRRSCCGRDRLSTRASSEDSSPKISSHSPLSWALVSCCTTGRVGTPKEAPGATAAVAGESGATPRSAPHDGDRWRETSSLLLLTRGTILAGPPRGAG